MKSNRREFKFRIWAFFDKHFVYFTLDEGTPSGYYGGISEPMQFTGLIDRNGKEVYEGDIIEYKYIIDKKEHSAKSLIQFQELPPGDDMDLLSFGYHINDLWLGEFEIIGNYFETPELLEK